MKLIRIISILAGFSIALMLEKILPISGTSLVVWLWMFCTGLLNKSLVQIFVHPVLDVPVDQQVPAQQIRYLDLIRSALLFSGLGFLIGEMIFYQAIGTISIALLLTGLGTHIGTHYTNKNKWFFNE